MIYFFDEFELDTIKFELRHAGNPVPVEPQVFTLIQLLAENSERLVSKREIIEQVWKDRIVSEAAISSRIRSARSALGDDGKAQRMIRTVHGKGLRFVGRVTVAENPCSSTDGPDMRGDRATSAIDDAFSNEGKPSIAVLPFKNFSPEEDNQYFSEGLTEEITTNLARFKDLFVFSRLTTTALAQNGTALQTLHRDFGVDFIVDGSIRKSADTLRVTFQLIDAASNGHILVEKIDRECTPDGLFDIQDRIAILIAGRIANRYGPLGDYTRRAGRPGRSTRWETYNWVTSFYSYSAMRDNELHRQIRDGLSKALENDPMSSDGWAALAMILLDEYRLHMNERPTVSALDEALKCASRAIRCDSQNAFAHQAFAIAHFHCGSTDEFRVAAENSLRLNSGKADALGEFGQCFYFLGDFERAANLLDQALELSPIRYGAMRIVRAGCYFMVDEYEAALLELKKTPMPGFFWYHAYLVAFHASLDNDEIARAELREMLKIYPDFIANLLSEAKILQVCPQVIEKFDAAWRKAGLEFCTVSPEQ